NLLLFFVLIIASWGVLWSLFEWGIGDLRYFTNQSNLLVAVTVFLVFVTKDDQKWFPYLAAIALVNIVMTGMIYHVMLATPPISFQSHLTHTLTPILYTLFYFIVISKPLKPKQFWILIIYPFIYFLFFLITGPFTGFYPYGFMNVAENGLLNVFKFTILYMLPAIALMSWILLYLKKFVESKIKG
ncbi:MAG: Pr6Pr family membrane protein, partial [Firmicutes bacterium]|nr:Pr6Pr family membrane protein [Bacillota bacterium]